MAATGNYELRENAVNFEGFQRFIEESDLEKRLPNMAEFEQVISSYVHGVLGDDVPEILDVDKMVQAFIEKTNGNFYSRYGEGMSRDTFNRLIRVEMISALPGIYEPRRVGVNGNGREVYVRRNDGELGALEGIENLRNYLNEIRVSTRDY